MSKKPHSDQPADDWAGLAQNLFGINLDKGTGDDDLLDDDMFKVELPKPPEPPVVIPQSEVEFAPVAESVPTAPVSVAVAAVTAKAPAKVPPARVAKPVPSDDEPFGFGVVEDSPVPCNAAQVMPSECDLAEDAGLTLPEDYDAEGLTLPADYDDGLTLAPEAAASSDDFEDEDDSEDEESDTKVLPVARGEAGAEGSSDARRRRQPRRTREDAYWDMLENWEWEEIPDNDSPRGEGERPRTQRGDRGGRSGGRSDRGSRGRDERPRSDTRPPVSATRPPASETRSPVENRPPREERRPAETAPASGSDSGERPSRPRSGDRPRDDRGPREDRPRGERRPERDDRRRDETRQAGPTGQSNAPATSPASGGDDFGSGIFEEQPKVASAPSREVTERSPRRPREVSVAQTSRAADAILRDGSGSASRSIEDELVWPDDESDVQSAPVGSVVETSGLPPAEAAGDSDEMVSASDVRPLDEDDDSRRPRRRRRRRREPRSDEERSSSPPDGNEGTTFDLSDALATDSDSPDFIPSAIADDSEMRDESSVDDATDENRSTDERGVRRRRRRRRRPGEGGPSSESGSNPDRQPSDEAEVETEAETDDLAEASGEQDYVVKPITYSNIPSWEDAIKYLLQPQLVGRNLGPDDADESLENDPRGSGGAEPTPSPPSSRRRSGGGGRGRRP